MASIALDRRRVRGTKGVWACPVCAAKLPGKGIGCFVHHQEVYIHSTGEYHRWCDLIVLEHAKHITELQRQVKYGFSIDGRHIFNWFADFVYWEDGTPVVEDFKGYQTDISKLKHKIIEAQYGIKILITGPKSGEYRGYTGKPIP